MGLEDEMLKAIGAEVRRARLARGWVLKDLADAACVSIPSVARVEDARGSQAWVVARVAAALGMSLVVVGGSRAGAQEG